MPKKKTKKNPEPSAPNATVYHGSQTVYHGIQPNPHYERPSSSTLNNLNSNAAQNESSKRAAEHAASHDKYEFFNGHVDTVNIDNVNHPSHYTQGGIEVIDMIVSMGDGEAFCRANAIKYLSRYKHKNGLEDLKKARWYLNKLIDLEGAKE